MGAPLNLDLDALRSFVTGMDLGSFARAADRLGRSPSAVSLHLRKLEAQVGHPLVRRHGRGLVPTEAGETLIAYARRILDLNDEAALALGNLGSMEGWLRVGMVQDHAETWLPGLLARFARSHAGVRVEARVDRGSAMVAATRAGELDLALTWGRLGNPQCEIVSTEPMVWIGAEGYRRDPDTPLPLVAFDAPCAFRQGAVAALDGAAVPWRHVFASPSLTGLWAAMSAGLGITVRIAGTVPPRLRVLDAAGHGLPALGRAELALHRSPLTTDAARAFAPLLAAAIRDRPRP